MLCSPVVLKFYLLAVNFCRVKLIKAHRFLIVHPRRLSSGFLDSLLGLLDMADEEPVDPKRELEDRCKAPCIRPLKEYQACVKRIQDDESGHKHCTGQYFDYWRCVDKCAATKLFSLLK